MAEKILIVDDDLDTLRLVGLMLQKQGYDIVAANNGEQGLRKAEEENPALILLDVMMPDMDGYEVTRRLRQSPNTANTPILMFTAKSQLDDKVTGFEAGVDDYLTKPTHPTELHAHVKALLARAGAKKDAAPPPPETKNSFVVGVLSARSGVGVSTVSLNLGSYLKKALDCDVIVAEMQPGLGTLGRDLGFDAQDEFSALLKSAPDAITEEDVKNALNQHKSGVQFLFASEQPNQVPLIESLPQYDVVVKYLANMPRFLLLDFGAGLSRMTQSLVRKCDRVIVVMEGVKNTIAHSKLLLADLVALGIEEEKISIVMNNRMRTDRLLSLSEVEKALGTRVTITFTPAPELHAQAIHLNSIGILVQEESISRQQYKKLAEFIAKEEKEAAEA